MKTIIHASGVKLWLSEKDTYDWAHKPGAAWPCSTLSGKRLFAEFDRNGVCDVAVNGRTNGSAAECMDGAEFNAITCDTLRSKLPESNPAYAVAVGQFIAEASK